MVKDKWAREDGRMPKTLPDEALTEQLRPTQFEVFYANQWREVYQPLAVTLRDSDLAREATDEAMVRAYQRWRSVRRMDNPAGWTYRVGLNWALSQLRRRRLVYARVLDTPSFDPVPADPVVANALAHLPIDQRAVVVRRYLCDETQSEIADALRVPVGTVRSRLSRALAQLREEVGA